MVERGEGDGGNTSLSSGLRAVPAVGFAGCARYSVKVRQDFLRPRPARGRRIRGGTATWSPSVPYPV